MKQINTRYKQHIIFCFAVAIFYCTLQIFGITCPIKYITGVSCLGCGMTRAYIALLRFDVKSAIYFHPLFFMPPIILLAIIFKSKINKSVYRISMYCTFFLFTLVYLIRLKDSNNSVVVFELEKSFFAKFIK